MLRLCLALFLIIPTPAFADEITEVETFEGGNGEQVTDIVVPPTENNNLVIVENTWEAYGGMDNYHMSLEHSKHGGTSNDYEFVLPTDHDVYEVAFTIGAMNNQGSVQYTHNDDTTQTNTIDAQNGMNMNTMYEDVVYSVKNTANKFIDKFVITINDWSLLDNVEIKYEGTTTTTLDPLTVQRNANFASYGILETDNEKGIRIEEEEIVIQELIIIEIQEAIEVGDNMAITGYSETDEERVIREELTNVVIVVGDEEVTYNEKEQSDGTIDRDQERSINEELYGVALTDEQIERGDLELYDVKIIDEDIYEEQEFVNDADILDIEFIELEDEEYIELIEEEIKEIDLELYEIELFQDDIIIDEVDWIKIRIENDLFPPTEEEIKEDLIEVQDELDETLHGDDTKREDELQDEEVLVEQIQDFEDKDTIKGIFDTEEVIELTEKEVAIEVAEIEEVIVIEIEIATKEEIEDFTEEELVEYEEAKEEAIQEYVEDLTEEEVVEVLEEVNDIGVQNLSEASEEVQEIVQAVVEEAIQDVAQLTTEQVEVVAEVLQIKTEDVELIAESVKDDEVIAEAVEEYIERAVANKDVENYTLADVVTEISYESFIENPIKTFVDFNNLGDITIANIGDDMTNDQKEKAQEVVVPVILTRIISMAAFVFRRGNV